MRLTTSLIPLEQSVRVDLDLGDGLILWLDDRLLGATRTEIASVRLLAGDVPDGLVGLRVRGVIRGVDIDAEIDPTSAATFERPVHLTGEGASGSITDRLEVGWVMEARRPFPSHTRWFARPVTTGALDGRELGLGGFVPDVVPRLEPGAAVWWHPAGRRSAAQSVRNSGYSIDADDLTVVDGELAHVFTAQGFFRQSVQRLRGQVTHRSTFDERGRPTSWTKGGRAYRADFQTRTQAVVSSPSGAWAMLTFEDGRVVAIEDHDGVRAEIGYDDRGALASVLGARGLRTKIERDEHGRVSSVHANDGARSDLVAKNLGSGREIRVISAEGRETIHRVETTEDGAVIETRSCCGATTERVVERRGDRVRVAEPDGTVSTRQQRSATGRDGKTTTNTTTTVVSPSGRALRSERHTTRTAATVSETVTFGTRSWTRVLDRPTRTLTVTSPSGRTTTSTLTPEVSLVVHAAGTPGLTIEFDDHNRPAQITSGGMSQRSGFDEHGRLAWTEVAGVRRGVVHDLNGDVQAIETGDGWLRFERDAEGLIVAIMTPHGSRHTVERDQRGAITAQRLAGESPTGAPASMEFGYDADGLLVEIRSPGLPTIHLRRDSHGRVERRSSGAERIDTVYDQQSGRRVSVTTGATEVTFHHDGDMEWAEEAHGPAPGRVERIYGEDHQIAAHRVNGEHELSVRRNADNEITAVGPLGLDRCADTGRIEARRVGVVTTHVQYDGHGRVIRSTTMLDDSTIVFDQLVTYGASGRIDELVESSEGSTRTTVFRYDEAGRLVEATDDDRVNISVDFDGNGNPTRIRRGGEVETYTFDAADRITTRNGDDAMHDGAGNLTAVGDDRFDFDDLRRFRAARVSAGQQLSHTLDGLGRPVVIESSAGSARLLWDRSRCVATLADDGAVDQRFVYSGASIAPEAMVAGGAAYALISDVHGSLRRIVDARTGRVTRSIDYDSFGRVLTETGSVKVPFGFGGGIHDHLSETVRFGARLYHTRSGRFLSPDPLGFAGGQTNFYQFAHGDPVNFVDPTGLQSTGTGEVSLCTDPMTGMGLSRPISVDHAYLKGPGFSRGMGPNQDRPGFVEWQDEKHRPEEQCRKVKNVDAACVDRMTQPGTPLGTYMLNFSREGGQGLVNTCYDAAWDVLNSCSGPTGWEYEENFMEEPEGPGYLETIGRIGAFITTPLDWAATAIKTFIWAS